MDRELIFYTHPMSRGRIARWMLEEVEVPYRTEVLAYGETMKSEDFRALNPMGKVPTIRHGDVVVTETAAICAYLADAFPSVDLGPRDDRERAGYYRWMFFAAGPLEAAVVNQALGVEVPDAKRAMVGYGSFAAVMDTLEYAVTQTDYIAGSRFTAADVYVGAHVGWGLQFGSIEKREAFLRYYQRVSDRDAYRRGSALDDALIGQG